MRTRTALRTAMSAAVALVGTSCGHEFEPPDREARVAEAAERFAEVSFDTVTWVGEDERALAGNEFYASRCRDCHGTLGRGATPYAIERGLEVPSLVEGNWRLSGQPDSIRFQVFVGHAAGMPNWGMSDVTLRQIDAVAFYILERLRPEIIDGG